MKDNLHLFKEVSILTHPTKLINDKRTLVLIVGGTFTKFQKPFNITNHPPTKKKPLLDVFI